jgi:DinB superfamily
VAAALSATPAVLEAEVRGLSDRLVSWHPAVDAWCVKEVIGHLIESEQHDFADRITSILSEDQAVLAISDQAELARSRRDCERDHAELLRGFHELRTRSLRLLPQRSTSRCRRAASFSGGESI